MTHPQTFTTAMQLPIVLLALTGALDQAGGDVATAAQNGGAFEDWAEAEPETRSCLLLSAAWGAGRCPAPVVADDVHPHVEGYVEDLHKYAAGFPDGGSEAFHGPAFPAMPLPGKAGAMASSLGFDRDDLEISFGTALVLLAAGRSAPAKESARD